MKDTLQDYTNIHGAYNFPVFISFTLMLTHMYKLKVSVAPTQIHNYVPIKFLPTLSFRKTEPLDRVRN